MQSVSWGGICFDNFMCGHTEIEAADTKLLSHSQSVDTGPAGSSISVLCLDETASLPHTLCL